MIHPLGITTKAYGPTLTREAILALTVLGARMLLAPLVEAVLFLQSRELAFAFLAPPTPSLQHSTLSDCVIVT